LTDFDAVFFIGLQKTTKVTWAIFFSEKERKRGSFPRKGIQNEDIHPADVIERTKSLHRRSINNVRTEFKLELAFEN